MEYGRTWNPDKCVIPGKLAVTGEILAPPEPKFQQNLLDPDYIKSEMMIARLEDEFGGTQQISINSSCDCAIANQLRLKKDVGVVSHIGYEKLDCDLEDEDDIKLPAVLKMLNRIKSNPLKRAPKKTFVTLLDTLSYRSKVTDEEATEIFQYIENEPLEIRDLTLCVVSHLCKGKANSERFLDLGILDLQSLPQSSSGISVLDKIVCHVDLKDAWLEAVKKIFLPLLLQSLKENGNMELKLNICCFLKRLSQLEEFSYIILNEAIPVIDSIKDNSARIKEVYIEIIMRSMQFADQISPSLLEADILPTACNLIQQGPCGPQKQALSLLVAMVTSNDGVAATISDSLAVPLVFCCIRQSKCRHVRREAVNVLCRVTSTRRLGLSKTLMEHMADHLVTPVIPCSYSVMDIPQTRTKYEREGLLWKGLEELSVLMRNSVCREAKITMETGCVQSIDFQPSQDSCPTCVGTLQHSVTVLLNVCLWPASKSRHDVKRIDLNNFTDSQEQQLKLSKINRVLTQTVWDNAGASVIAVLLQFSKKLKRIIHISEMIHGNKGDNSHAMFVTEASQKYVAARNKNGTIDIGQVFTREEVQLIEKILEFLLCVSLCTCKRFIDLTPKSSDAPISQKGRMAKSDSVIGKVTRKPPRPTSACNFRSSSPTKRDLPDNPPNTPRHTPSSENFSSDPLEKHHMDFLSKEEATDRRLLRKCLYEAGVFHSVAPFMHCSHQNCQTMACQILRCNIQPLDEKVMPSLKKNRPRMRPQSAIQGREAEKKLGIALHRMSPDLAGMIKDALGPRPTPVQTPRAPSRPQSAYPILNSSEKIPPISVAIEMEGGIADTEAAARLSEFIETSKQTRDQTQDVEVVLPVIDVSQPIAAQCRQQLLECCTKRILSGLFNFMPENRKYFLWMLYDLVHFGEVSLHMKLSEYGCMQKLLDFLRVNTGNEQLAVTGLMIVQVLCQSDCRLKQMFDRHGGTRLLMAWTRNTHGILRQEVSKTLKAVTADLSGKKTRLKSAPVVMENKEPDVWDKIMERWKVEDQVCQVLRQWIKK